MFEKYKTLILSSFILLSFAFIYDIPSAISGVVDYGDDSNKAKKLTMLYAVYALPNILIPLIFSWIFEVNLQKISEILCILVFLGQLIYTCGIIKTNYTVMITGRFIYGLGGESFSVLQNRLISSKYRGKNMAFSLGLFASISRLGSILNFSLSPLLAVRYSAIFPCVIGCILTFLSIIACLMLNGSLKFEESQGYIVVETKKSIREDVEQSQIIETKVQEDVIGKKEILKSHSIGNEVKTPSQYYSTIFYEIDFNEDPFTPWEQIKAEQEIIEDEPINNNSKENSTDNPEIFFDTSISTKNTSHFTFPLLVMMSFFIALIWAPFYSLAPILLETRFNIKIVESGRLLALIDLMGIITTPIFGFIADKIGYKLLQILIGNVLLIISHFCIYLKEWDIHKIIILIGISGPLVNSYWSCIPNLISENNLTSGFAGIFCALNLAFTISPIAMGILASRDKSLDYVELFILLVSFVAFLLASLLYYLNQKFNLGLNRREKNII